MTGPCGHSWDGSLHRGCPRCAIAGIEAIHGRVYQKLKEAESIGPSTFASAADAHYYMREKVREALAILMPTPAGTSDYRAELTELRRKWLALAGNDAIEIHGWLIGVAIAIERKRGANPADSDALVAELRASTGPHKEAAVCGCTEAEPCALHDLGAVGL